jgi:hypothetical protein
LKLLQLCVELILLWSHVGCFCSIAALSLLFSFYDSNPCAHLNMVLGPILICS